MGPVVFAGEHTDFPHGWIDTAVRSGVRAAVEVHQAVDMTLLRGHKYNQCPRLPRKNMDTQQAMAAQKTMGNMFGGLY